MAGPFDLGALIQLLGAASNVRRAAAGDEMMIGGQPHISYGGYGTRLGGDRFNEQDQEGDLDVNRWEKDRNDPANDYRDFRGVDVPNPNDAKGWRREFFRKKPGGERPSS